MRWRKAPKRAVRGYGTAPAVPPPRGPITRQAYDDLFKRWEAEQDRLRQEPVPAPEIVAADLLECCDHPADVHSEDLGCWLCDCTVGRVA